MICWKAGLVAAMLTVSTASVQEADTASFDMKLHKMVSEHTFPDGDADTVSVDEWETSKVISFSESFKNMTYGDVIGHIEVEFTKIDSDIVYAQNRNDAAARSEKNENAVYLFRTVDGDGLNAPYFELYAAESLMPDYDEMKEIGARSDDRYLHLWIEVGAERLQMDILAAYYSDDMQTASGRLYAMIEDDFLSKEDSATDFTEMEYIGDCLSGIPEGYTFDKMVVIDNMQHDVTDHKRIIVAVNLASE